MRLELKDLKNGFLEQDVSFSAADFPVSTELSQDGIEFVAPVKFHLRLQQSGQLVEVDGRLETAVSLSCGRCLQPYEKALSSQFALTFTPYVADAQQEDDVEVELDTDELGLVYYKDEYLELLPPLQDQLVMALPIAPLCSEECRGLCLECGCNLNNETCNCEKKIFNNKFSALAGLKLESSEKKD